MTNHRISPQRPRHAVIIVLSLLLIGLAAAAKSPLVQRFDWFDLSMAQVAAFPILFSLLAGIVLAGCSVPRMVLIPVAVCAASAVAVAYSHVRRYDAEFILARLAQDEYEVETRVFRQRLNDALRADGMTFESRAVWHYAPLSSSADALALVRNDLGIQGVVWGGKRWLSVVFNPQIELFPMTATRKRWERIVGLRLVPHVAASGLSFEPREASAQFLAMLFSALSGVRQAREQEGGLAYLETQLRAAASLAPAWSAPHHLALAEWILGNVYTATALNSGGEEAGYLQCALKAYNRARLFVERGGNPELLAAIYNNRGFVLTLKAMREGQRKLARRARKDFKAGSGQLHRRDIFGLGNRAAKIARSNWQVLKERTREKWLSAGKLKKLGGRKKKGRKNVSLIGSQETTKRERNKHGKKRGS